jgi:hypothetical protein
MTFSCNQKECPLTLTFLYFKFFIFNIQYSINRLITA